MAETTYNCEDVARYEGLAFITESGSRYSIKDGRLHGREILEGALVRLVTGATQSEGWHFRNSVLPDEGYYGHATKEVRDYVRSIEKPVKKGLQLMIAFDDETARQYERHGFVTSPIQRIEKIKRSRNKKE